MVTKGVRVMVRVMVSQQRPLVYSKIGVSGPLPLVLTEVSHSITLPGFFTFWLSKPGAKAQLRPSCYLSLT